MRTVRRTALALATVAAVAACGTGEDRSPEERVAAAAEATRSAGSAAFDLEMQLDMGEQAAGMNMTMSGEGVADLEERIGRLEIRSPGVGAAVTTVFDGDVTYTRLPSYMAGGETRWVRQTGSGAVGGNPARGMGNNPFDLLAAVDTVAGTIEPLGADTVRGTEVQGFGFQLSGARLWGDADSVPKQLRELQIPSELWLDGSDRVRRLVMEIDLGPVMQAAQERMAREMGEEEASGLGQMLGAMQGTMTLTAVLHDFGTEVDVTVPDSADVVDRETFQEEMRQRSRGAGGGGG